MSNKICVVVIHYQTPDLLSEAMTSFRTFYPNNKLVVIDNGSALKYRNQIKRFQENSTLNTNFVFLQKNIFHGPAMDYAAHIVDDDLIFYLDSDTEVKCGGFLEKMESIFAQEQNVYAVGSLRNVNKRGFVSEKGLPMPATAHMMIRRSLYIQLPAFEHHGMPILRNMQAAYNRGWKIKSFPIEDYIEHKWQGTANRFGYNLGIRGKIDYLLNKIGL